MTTDAAASAATPPSSLSSSSRPLSRSPEASARSTARRRFLAVGSNAELMAARETEVLLCGPAGTGKTRTCLERVHRDLRLYPKSRAMVVRKTRVSLSESALKTYETQVLSPNSPIREGPTRKFRSIYHYPNGSELVVGGLDRPSKLFSTEYDLIYVQEAIELGLDDWQSLLRMLRNFRMRTQQIIADTNPSHPKHWLKRRCDAGDCRMIAASHADNPAYVDPETGRPTPKGRAYLGKLRQMRGVIRLRLLNGLWAAADGLVYESFDPSVHLIDPFPVPEHWRRFRSIDFGYVNPFVCQWWAIGPDGELHLYRELYVTKRTVRSLAPEIVALSEGERIETTVADHDRGDRETLAELGVPTVPAIKDIETGLKAVQDRLAIQGNGKPRLYLHRGASVRTDPELLAANKPASTEEEFPLYLKPPAGGSSKSASELPIDADNHGMDAMRYGVRYADLPHHRSLVWL